MLRLRIFQGRLFREYLGNKNMMKHDQSILYTSAYLEFKAALNANNPQEIPKLSYEYMQLLTPDIQTTTLQWIFRFH
jgi:hypothetical protein